MLLRRDLLLSSLAMPGLGLAQGLDQNLAVSRRPARPGTSGAPPRWVVVLLRGAVDGLSVCVPHADPGYAEDRPSIALGAPGTESGSLALDARFGLHPALAAIHPLWARGELGFVHACGQPQALRSHFEAQDELEAGTPGVKTTADGWLARLMAQTDGTSAREPVKALYTAAVRPKILTGPGAAHAAALPGTVRNAAARNARPALNEGLQRLYEQDPHYAQAWRDAQLGREQVNTALENGMAAEAQRGMSPEGTMAGNLQREMQAADRGAPPAGSFPDTARRLAQALRADPRLQFAALELGGWDTHARQGAAQGQLAGRLAPLGEGLAQLARGLGPLWQDTVVTVVSEFGRTVRENGNGGTDHGHGNALWLLGGALAGGAGGRVLGRWPGLERSARFEGRDLAVTTDYRAVLAGVAGQHLGLPDRALAQLFPGFAGAPLSLRA